MKEPNKTATMISQEENGTTDNIDESARQVVDDYSRRLLGFIQQEREKARKQSREESARVLAEAQSRGQLAYEQIVREANAEADRITTFSRDQADQLTADVQKLLQTLIDLRDKSQKDIEDIRNRLQLEAASLAEAMRRTDKAIADSRGRLAKEFEASASSLTQVMQALRVQPRPRQTPEAPLNTVSGDEGIDTMSGVVTSAPHSEEFPKKHSDKTFSGTINLEIEKGSSALLKRFKEALGKVPGLEISATDDYSKDKARIVAFASRPIILMNILNQMSLVKGVTADKSSIQIVLQDPDRWVG
jgi:hypothetical protein